MFDWITRWFRAPAHRPGEAHAHMTFGETSVGRTMSRTGNFLKKQLWVWPIIAVFLLAAIGLAVGSAIDGTIKDGLRSELQTLLQVEVSMLETWLKVQEANAEALANDQQVRAAATEILTATQPDLWGDNASAADNGAPTTSAPKRATGAMQSRFAHELAPGMSSHQFVDYFLVDKRQVVVAAQDPTWIGESVEQYERFLRRTLSGESAVSSPFPSITQMKDEFGRKRSDVPTMFVCAPIRDANFQIVAALALRIRPEREFTRILQLGRIGDSGETYAFDKGGVMVSNSRFDDELILLGLLPDVEHAQSILNVALRDPGGNMAEGFRPEVRRAELPLTRMAADATSGGSGVDVEGYRNYRGVPTVGAWQWLPKYDMGVATEINHAEAFRPLTILRWTFYSILALLALCAAAIFVFTVIVGRLQREAQKAAVEAKQLGQYRLEERLGAGAMGVVYKGRHAMLRRPTAIKMLDVERVNEASIERFEREVQITCKLNHPNTIAIYDYGRTPEGVFYYAMEFLDGIDLQALVDKYGPQPEGRVIRILKQMCGSLFEAHSLGLVHRDIKPANVMLNRRGGVADVVKILDFGLVKALEDEKRARQSGGMAGTPLYMSPESIQTPDLVDARSDIYAVGAVGYFLLTGHPVFNATTLVELCQQHVAALPDSPSQRLGRPVSSELECALLSCLDKSRANRPQTARDLAALIARAPTANSWTTEDAESWWGRHERGQAIAPTSSNSSGNGSFINSAHAATTPPLDIRSKAPTASNTSTSGFDRTIDH